ncbi:hypothetical protein QAD02_010913 [Eretmocerus hayati]|uniref:Uncharacterized protein n=1 Tax=Eretmocerus hayati TaxID=131215 RepID=A0ACC2NVG2_9HYME|nr:hypothetical protein QAD02_010913 [Eretmocerus hayati]
MLEFFMKYSKYIRGKCIILLVNGDGQSLESFLRLAWSNDFLDLTVIEWIVEVPDKFLMGQDSVHYQAYIHVFNPFENKYSKDVLEKGTDVLPDKLKNLHGYELRTPILESGWVSRIDKNYKGTNDLDKFQGEDVQRTKLLSEILKFKANTVFVPYKEWVSDGLYDAIKVSGGDYTTSVFVWEPVENNETLAEYVEWTNNQSTSTAYLQSMSQTRLYVIQQYVKEPYTSNSFILSCSSLATMILIFSSFSRILKLNGKIWSVAKITHVLMGGSMDRQRGISFREKIFLITLYLTSIITMTITSDELLKMNLSKKQMLRFKTLQELADSGVSLRVTQRLKAELLDWGRHNHILKKIADQAIESESVAPLLGDILANTTSTWVYAGTVHEFCDWLSHVDSLDGLWFATVIDENIESRIKTMRFREYAPYKNRFVEMTTKLIESGLMTAYLRQDASDYSRDLWRYGVVPRNDPARHRQENDKEVEMPIINRLILILSIGYCLACLALSYEFIAVRQRSMYEKMEQKMMLKFQKFKIHDMKNRCSKIVSRA